MEEPRIRTLAFVGVLIVGAGGISWAEPVGTAFTYQGQLKEGGSPANGAYDFKFALYNDPKFGSQVGDLVEILNQDVTGGLFTVLLDFGNVFDDTALWLWVLVRESGAGSYTPLWPRQPLTATPYAIYALGGPPSGAAGGDLTGSYPDPQIANDAVGAPEIAVGGVGTSEIADGAVTQQKIDAPGALNGKVLKTDGAAMYWGTDLTGSGSKWANDANGIWTEQHVGINENPSPDFDLHIGGDLRVTQRAMLIGDVTLGCASCNPLRVEDNIEIGGTVTIDWLSGGSGTTVVWDSSNGRLYRLSSSLRYKHDVADLPATKEGVLRLRPVTFTWNSTGEADIGLIAEEVAEVIPDLVLYDAEGRPDGVKYDRLGVYLLQVVKSQRGQIADLTVRLERMEAVMRELGKAEKGGGR